MKKQMHPGLWQHWESFITLNQKTLQRDEVHNADQSIVIKTIKSETVGGGKKKREVSYLYQVSGDKERKTGKPQGFFCQRKGNEQQASWTGKL